MPFLPIESREELEAEFGSINRLEKSQIAGLIVGWTRTAYDQHINAKGLHELAKSQGKDGLEWHMVINRDGRLERGRPFSMPGNFNSKHNNNFLGLVMVGGYLETAKYVREDSVPTAQSYTNHQMKVFDKVVDTFLRVYPNAYVISNSITGEADGPGFDVARYARSRFKYNKGNPRNATVENGIRMTHRNSVFDKEPR
jgi:hypothetical protein